MPAMIQKAAGGIARLLLRVSDETAVVVKKMLNRKEYRFRAKQRRRERILHRCMVHRVSLP